MRSERRTETAEGRRTMPAFSWPRVVRWLMRSGGSLVPCLAWLALWLSPAAAQELEPRAYSPSPVGANFAGVTYSRSWGSLLFDATVPITDAEAKINGLALGYGRTFSLFGAQALVTAGLPVFRGTFSGQVVQTDTSVRRTGMGDMRAKLSVNLIGGPALSPQAFARAPARSVVAGASLTISAPTGQNYPEKLINIGANRWAFKPEAGVSYNWRRKWYADAYAGVWLFTANPSFYPGTVRRQQDPLTSLQGHLSYTFARRTWAALDGTWYSGGASRSNGGPPSARLNNKRVGAILAIGLTARQSIKLGYSFGAATRVGDDFGTIGVAYQTLWF
jgi:Putative MetA-pathway of phenol degradation